MIGGGRRTRMQNKRKPKLAVIRGVRPPEALFYDAFGMTEVKFIFATQKPTAYPIRTENLELVNLRLKPKYLIDPISLFNRGVYTHRSWIEVAGLEEHLKDVDVVNVSDTFHHWCAQAARITSRLGKKLVTIIWETIPNQPGTFIPPYPFNVREVVKNTDLFILRSKTALRFTDSIGIPREKVKVIYKGVDLDLFHPPKPSPLNPKPSLRILYVGQLTSSKGVDDLLKAFVILSPEFPHAELVLAGTGPLERDIRDLAGRYPIKFRGFVDYLDLPSVYRDANIFCSPSRDLKYFGVKVWEELFSYTLMEAQACGLPIVATKCGGIPEELGSFDVAQDKQNLLVDQGDVEGLYQALKKLVKNGELRFRIGRENRERAERLFDLKVQAKKTEEAILSIL